MRFVAIKSETRQAAAGIHKVPELLVKQRTMLINALRGQRDFHPVLEGSLFEGAACWRSRGQAAAHTTPRKG